LANFSFLYKKKTQVVYVAILGLHGLEMMISPPSRYPDLFAVLNVLISTPVFVLTWLWSIKCGVQVGWALSGLGSISSVSKSSKEDADGATSIGHPSECSVETAENTLIVNK
jgi:alpha-1,3-glucosyltransferase